MIKFSRKIVSSFCFTIGLLLGINLFAQSQIINTIAGNGVHGYIGDGGPSTASEVNSASGVAVDGYYNVYIGDFNNNRVRVIKGGIITTYAGNGTAGYSGDGGPATDAQLSLPAGVATDNKGNVYIADFQNQVIRKVTAQTGIITTIAGNSNQGFSGDGGQATDAELHSPLNVAVDTAGNVFIADTYNFCIRKVDAKTGIITTVAGTNVSGYYGDGGPATDAQLTNTWGVAVDDSDNIYIADTYNDVIRKVNGYTGIISTIVGDGNYGYYGDGGLADTSEIAYPLMVALDSANNLYIADYGNNVIREVDKATDTITTVAGDGNFGFAGDGGPARLAKLSEPWSLALDPSKNIYFSDLGNNRIRDVIYKQVPYISVTTGPVAICSGSSTPLTASGAKNYSWSPGTGLSATTGSSVTASPITTTTYTVAGTDSLGRTGKNNIIVEVFPKVNLTFQPISPSVCKGQTLTLKVYGATSYNWIGAFDNTDSIQVNPTQDTTYELIASNGPCILDTFISVKYNASVILNVQPLNPIVCNGQNVTLTIAGGGSNFYWSPSEGLNTNEGDTVVVTPTINTTYIVTGFDSIGCMGADTDVVTIGFPPDKPTVTVSVTGDSLISSAAQGYQWYLNDSIIANATNQTLVISKNHKGFYKVIVTDSAGCSNSSDSTTNINELVAIKNQISIYPNPTDGELFINLNPSLKNIREWRLDVTDCLGRKVFSKESLTYNNELDLSELPDGIYFIALANKTARIVLPVVKQM